MGKGKQGCTTEMSWRPEAGSGSTPSPLLAPIPFFEGEEWQRQQAEHIEQLCQELRQDVEEYTRSDQGWRAFLEMQAHIHPTSAQNTLWRWLQLRGKNGDETEFDPAGLTLPESRWKQLGRRVRPEHRRYRQRPAENDRYAATQLMPVKVWVDERDAHGNPVLGSGGKPRKKQVVLPGRFQTYNAYHVDATEGDPLPDDPWRHTTGSEQDAALLRGHLEQACAAQGVEVLYQHPGGSARGSYTPSERAIRIDPDLPVAEQASVFLHEFIHHVAGDGGRGDKLSREAKEIATQSAVHVVASRYGLQDQEATFPYLASWCSGEGHRISELTGEIQRRCRCFFEAVDPVLQTLAQAPAPRAKRRKRS